MDKLKNLLPGHSNDKAEAEAKNTSQPSGKLTGEATHLDQANMPGAWRDESSPTYEATKGTGISSNPSTVPNVGETVRSTSTEAARGTGISSAIGNESHPSATGSRATPQSGHNPDALAAASSALGTTGSGVAPTSNPSSTSKFASTSTTAPAQTTSHTTTSSKAANTGTPIADSFAGAQKPSGTEYVGGSAPGVAGQSVTREAPFSTSTSSGTGRDHTSTLAAGAAGATAGGLTGQALTDENRPAQGTSATVSPSYTERSQPLSGTSTAAKSTGTGTPATIAGFGSTSSHGAQSSSPSSGTKVSQPFASDPVSTEPLAGSSAPTLASGGLASQGTSHYTGDSRDYSSGAGGSSAGLATGSGGSSATSGAYSGGPAPGVSGQSSTSAAPELTSGSTRGQGGAGLAAGAAAGAVGAGGIAAATHDTNKPHHSTVASSSTASDFMPDTSTPGTSVAGSPQQSKEKTATGVGYGDQYNRLSDGTPSGIAVSDPARGSTADRTTGTSSTTVPGTSDTTGDSGHHYGRDAAGIAGVGAAGGVAAHELDKDRSATTAPSSGSYNVSSSQAYLGSGGPQVTTTGSSKPYEIDGTTAAYTKQAPQYATPVPLPSTSQADSSTGGSHLGRDAAVAGGAGAGAAGIYEATKQHSGSTANPSSTGAPTTTNTVGSSSGYGDQYNRLSDGTPSGIATSDPAFPSSGTAGGVSQQQSSTGQHHYGRDAAIGGAGATALAGTGAALAGTSGDNKTSTTSSAGYGDQYNRLSDGTPSGIATSDPAHQTIGGTGSDSQHGQHHTGRDAAVAGTAAAATGAGAAAYGSSGSHTGPTGTSASTSGGYGDQYNHLKDGTPSGIAVSDPATQNVLPTGTQSQQGTSDQHHYGRDAAIGGAGVAGAGSVAYGLSEHEKKVQGVPGTSNTAATHGQSMHEGPTKPSALTTEPHSSHQHESLDEPDSPTGTGETKKKKGFLSKILHRDDPNKLHKESKESRKSLEAEGADVPRTTHDAYASNTEGGKTSHFGTDGEIGRGGQAISGYGHQDARQALPLREAEKLEHSAGSGAGHTGHQ